MIFFQNAVTIPEYPITVEYAMDLQVGDKVTFREQVYGEGLRRVCAIITDKFSGDFTLQVVKTYGPDRLQSRSFISRTHAHLVFKKGLQRKNRPASPLLTQMGYRDIYDMDLKEIECEFHDVSIEAKEARARAAILKDVIKGRKEAAKHKKAIGL